MSPRELPDTRESQAAQPRRHSREDWPATPEPVEQPEANGGRRLGVGTWVGIISIGLTIGGTLVGLGFKLGAVASDLDTLHADYAKHVDAAGAHAREVDDRLRADEATVQTVKAASEQSAAVITTKLDEIKVELDELKADVQRHSK